MTPSQVPDDVVERALSIKTEGLPTMLVRNMGLDARRHLRGGDGRERKVRRQRNGYGNRRNHVTQILAIICTPSHATPTMGVISEASADQS